MKLFNLFRRLHFKVSNNSEHCRTLTYRIVVNRNMSSINKEDSVYEVCFKSCGQLYQRWRKEGKFRKLPNGDLDFKVTYVDTHKDLASKQACMPTVVALHGAPGSHKDFSGLISYLHQSGFRVVAPNFPDFSVFEPGIFRHSAEEKAQFVMDFLTAICISKVDALIVHSSAVYPALILCLNKYPLIRSLVMLNPGTFTYDMKSTKDIHILRKVVTASEVSIFYKILQLIGPSVMRMIKVPVRVDNFLDPLVSATAMVHANMPEVKENYQKLSKNGFSMLYTFSNDDKLIGKECSYSLAHLLGASDSDIYIYDANGTLKQNGKDTSPLKILAFEKGSHYVFWRHADIINKEISNFVAKL